MILIINRVKMDNTIVCRNAKISAKCELKDCAVAGQHTVPPSTFAKGEHLVEFLADED